MFKKDNSTIIIDISSKLTLLNVRSNGSIKIEALKIVDFNLPQKSDNTRGARDDILINSLRNFLKENNIKHKNVIIRTDLNSLLIKRLQLPAVPDKELAEAIKWQIKEEVSYDLSAAILDFSVIKKTNKEDGSKSLDVISVAAKEEEIKHWVLLLKQAGLNCLAVGLLPFGYEKLMQRYFRQEVGKTRCILHIDHDNSYIFIYQDNKLDFYRELPVSINKFRESLRSILFSERGRIELSENEIEEILFRVGIPENSFVYKDKLGAAQILAMIRPVLERLVTEVKRSLSYYHSQFQRAEVNNVIVCGAAIGIPGMEDFLSKELSLKVERVSLEGKIEVSHRIDKKNMPQVVAYLGLAMDYSHNINLLPHEFRTEKIEKVEKKFIYWITFIVFLLFIVSFILSKVSISSYERLLDNARLHLNVLSEVRETKTKIDELNSFVKELKESEYPLEGMLKKLSNITPVNLFLVDFSLDSASGSGLIKGFVKSNNNDPNSLLAKFINDMRQSPYFRDASILSTQKNKYQDADITEFNISFKLP